MIGSELGEESALTGATESAPISLRQLVLSVRRELRGALRETSIELVPGDGLPDACVDAPQLELALQMVVLAMARTALAQGWEGEISVQPAGDVLTDDPIRLRLVWSASVPIDGAADQMREIGARLGVQVSAEAQAILLEVPRSAGESCDEVLGQH